MPFHDLPTLWHSGCSNATFVANGQLTAAVYTRGISTMANEILLNAITIACRAHQRQRRKWGEELPYIVHPARVAAKVATLSGTDEADLAAAWLHDVLEDCGEHWATAIAAECGPTVLALVGELTYPTDTAEWEHRPRAEKNQVRLQWTARMSKRAQRIKLVDRWDNVRDLQATPSRLIEKYIVESRQLLALLRDADRTMAAELESAITELENSPAARNAESTAREGEQHVPAADE